MPSPDNQDKKTSPDSESNTPGPEELDYEVMPRFEGGGGTSQPQQAKPVPPEPDESAPRWRIWLISLGGLLVLAVGGYLFYVNFFADDAGDQSGPRIEVPAVTETEDEALDGDEDGLSDEAEERFGTRSDNPDTDGDGLADGDEVNIYGSDPLLSDTDGDGFDDGREAARGFSPILAETEPASEEETNTWEENIAEFGLHEPTKTTLVLKKQEVSETTSTTYENTTYAYSFTVPAVLESRETEEGRSVGLYVAGSQSAETDVRTDPIFVTTAVKVEGQTLSQWMDSTYDPAGYESRSDTQINGIPAVQLTSLADGSCPSDLTAFSSGSTVIILTLSCNEQTEFAELYNQVVQSFSFTNE